MKNYFKGKVLEFQIINSTLKYSQCMFTHIPPFFLDISFNTHYGV